jgi:hypothetical protein
VIYIREAHAADTPRARATSNVNDPTTFEERVAVAKECAKELELGIPFAIDDMEDTVAIAYDAYPDRLYVVGADGKVAYQGGRGPKGFQVDEMTAKLETLLSKAK